ncbi:Toluene efflux pump periplasmic linker protein TtgA precursor [Gemmata sp. SH-PL17]|uniref:efflux RND transporter periplasmic adaptor subunit n=1 Tax=Gemmata sp. SH-PL17 TaxID=1630693 RepID=UPI00078C98FE|nr:efflux RND transporter periplasmic adaptor subunit [Gemmata sp. SH-PL17]AMV27066.1 Toluene efflux pump periplasmic linker protein TtgA precursor [Gemmata sp. SH-PL17]
MSKRALWGGSCLGALLIAFTAGCRQKPAQQAGPTQPVVPVSHPVQREVTEFVEYTGRTDAVQAVGIRARVTGYLVRSPFKEGDIVRGPSTIFGARLREGDLLFEIDPRPYKAQLEQAQSQVKLGEAQLKLAEANYARAKDTFDKGAGSKQDLDTAKATVDEANARIEAAKSSVKLYDLNLSFTQVRAPISGQVSRYYYTLGNLINQDSTLLTTVVSVDPMYAYFDLDERTLLRVRTAINQGKIQVPAQRTELPVAMGLEGETGFPHQGTIDFVNNVVNPSTGTIAVRGIFPNPKPEKGSRLLSPGMFVRIRVPIGQPRPALLVVDRALGSDQGQKYAYVVNEERKIEYRRVKAGALQDDGLRVIEEGLKPTDWVVVGALQQLKPKMEIDPEQTAMPVPGAPAQDPSAPAPPKQ